MDRTLPGGISASVLLTGLAGTVLCIGGSCGQLVSLNFWLQTFPNGAGPFTVLTLVATCVALLTGSALAIWYCTRPVRPKLRFVVCKESLGLLFCCGMCYCLNGVLLVFATPATPELLQALLLSTGIVWTFAAAGVVELYQRGLASFRAMDRRAALVPISFLLCTAGVILGAGSFSFAHMTASSKKWTVIFALAQVPSAVFNVLAGHYMARFSESAEVSVAPTIVSGVSFRSNDLLHHALRVSDPKTVKLVLMFGSSLVQAVMLFVFFPLDWTPGYGSAANAHEAAQALAANYRCVFFGHECSSDSFVYFIVFSLSYAGSLLGNTLLNQISPPMCSMVSQLSTPTGALLLIVVPAWNVTGNTFSAAQAVGALFLVTAGSVLYVIWARFLQSDEALALAGDNGSSLIEDALLNRDGDDNASPSCGAGDYGTMNHTAGHRSADDTLV